jgi:hypothetical protein
VYGDANVAKHSSRQLVARPLLHADASADDSHSDVRARRVAVAPRVAGRSGKEEVPVCPPALDSLPDPHANAESRSALAHDGSGHTFSEP